jgi:hypothetical protein
MQLCGGKRARGGRGEEEEREQKKRTNEEKTQRKTGGLGQDIADTRG